MRIVHDWIETSQLLREMLDVYTGLKTNNPGKTVCLEVSLRTITMGIDSTTVFTAEKEIGKELWRVYADDKIADAFYRLDNRLVY